MTIRFFTRIALAITLLVSAPIMGHADSVPDILAMPVTGVIDKIKNAANEVIEKLSNEMDSNSFLIAQRLRLLMVELDILAQNFLDKTFSEISSAEQKILKDVFQVLSNFDVSSTHFAGEMNRVLNNANGVLGTLPFMNRAPRLEEYGRRFYIDNSLAEGIKVSFSGYFLDHGNPALILSLSNEPCKLISNTRQSSEFHCKKIQLNDDSAASIRTVDGLVRFEQERGWWQRFVGLFFDNKKYKSYPLSLFIVPVVMGEYELVAVVEKNEIERNPRTQPASHSNDYCQGTNNRTFNFSSAAGWQIDVNSISVSCDASSRSRCNSVANVSSTSFQYTVAVTNNGSCGPRSPVGRRCGGGGRRTWCDGRGSVTVSAKWDDIRPVKTEVSMHLAKDNLHWGKEVALKLPNGTKSFLLTIRQVNGSDLAISSTERRKWFDIEHDVKGLVVFVRPKDAEVALAER